MLGFRLEASVGPAANFEVLKRSVAGPVTRCLPLYLDFSGGREGKDQSLDGPKYAPPPRA